MSWAKWRLLATNLPPGFPQHCHCHWLYPFCSSYLKRVCMQFSAARCIHNAALFERACDHAVQDIILTSSQDLHPHGTSFMNVTLPPCLEVWQVLGHQPIFHLFKACYNYTAANTIAPGRQTCTIKLIRNTFQALSKWQSAACTLVDYDPKY